MTIKPGNIIEVSDNGRGIPVDIQPKLGIPAVTVVYTVLHAGGKFGGEDSGYKVAGGLHGVGASVVNALSEWLTVRVRRDGAEYEQSFKRGKPDGDLKKSARRLLPERQSPLSPTRRCSRKRRSIAMKRCSSACARKRS